MKKTLLAVALLGAFSAAQAQSNVTLYGVLDAGVTYVSKQAFKDANGNIQGGSNWLAQSGVAQGSRWGLRGSEDLGGGLKAIFTLENGFDVFSGQLQQGGRMFGRQSFVGLSSNSLGTVTLGRQYDSVVDFLQPVSSVPPFGLYGAHFGDVDNIDNTFRTNNSVKYTSVNYNGLTFGGMFSFGGQAGQFATNRAFSVGTGYANGPLTLGAAYLNVNNPSAAVYDNGGTLDKAVFGATPLQQADQLRVFGVGGSYSFGPATIGLLYTNTKLKNSSFIAGGSDIKVDNYEINAKYMLTPALQLAAMYTYTNAKFDRLGSKPKYHQVNLGVDYWLSKRTDAYVMGVYQKAAGDAKNAEIYGLGASSTDKQIALRVGLRHKF
ncbi:porin [Pandoraea apista]|uniref:porin n=1 Tax=Pandoraea apista TaxID=93218 RepID=UPI000F679DBB|nr:porin [Pandoraea apista]RSD12454.1 porin [Pandoraea apista]